jgi:hypothetical protein
VRGPDGLAIFECWFRGHRYQGAGADAVANAAFIVKAVNSHDALLEALKYFAALKDCDEESEACEGNSGPYCSTHGDTDLHVDAIKAARAAIAKAEGSLP